MRALEAIITGDISTLQLICESFHHVSLVLDPALELAMFTVQDFSAADLLLKAGAKFKVKNESLNADATDVIEDISVSEKAEIAAQCGLIDLFDALIKAGAKINREIWEEGVCISIYSTTILVYAVPLRLISNLAGYY